MRFLVIIAAMLSACAPIERHTYTEYFDACMTVETSAKMTHEAAYARCTMFSFNACTSVGCKK